MNTKQQPDDKVKDTQKKVETNGESTFENEDRFEDQDSFDDALFEMQMLYRSRCVDVPLTSNVKVIDLDEEESKTSEKE